VIYTLSVKLAVATSSETIEVSADTYTLDTTTTTQTTILDSAAVDNVPLNGRDFTQLTALTPGFASTGANGGGSLNGTRINQINWQIDGVDNNDIWHNIPAVNQSGVSGIAGVVLPLDAIEQFSVQTNAAAESGRNPGGTVTLGLKSGTNTLHGSAYYFDRNELFGAKNPFAASKQKVRNYNDGLSVGGPIVKDHLFAFLSYEHQRFVIGVPAQNTEPTTVWQPASITPEPTITNSTAAMKISVERAAPTIRNSGRAASRPMTMIAAMAAPACSKARSKLTMTDPAVSPPAKEMNIKIGTTAISWASSTAKHRLAPNDQPSVPRKLRNVSHRIPMSR